MRSLPDVSPTPEQLAIVARNRPGTLVIRGAAGSGKTTTALLRLRALIGFFVSRRNRLQREEPVNILVLTFNRTLRGYIDALAQRQITGTEDIDLEISTFARWAKEFLGNPPILDGGVRRRKIRNLGSEVRLTEDFLVEEVEYVMGRFPPELYANYLTARRDGRGITPRVDRNMRREILNTVVEPYQQWKSAQASYDWNDLAVEVTRKKRVSPYDIVIADETQDFSANQIRAVKEHVADKYSLTFVLDTAQRIYARGFTWQEVGISVPAENSFRLKQNYRNTIEIAQFVLPLVKGIPIDDDATIPDFSRCEKHGPKPIVLKGKFNGQMSFVVDYIQNSVDLKTESVAILHPLGWFNATRRWLSDSDLAYVEITRESEWPEGEENIALSTLHSAKGLEFDHVVVVGLNAEVTPHGEEESDDRLIMLRRLLSMGIGRARKSVIVGYKPEDVSRLVNYFDPSTFQELEV